MCLYPRLIHNRKYRANKKNGGEIPPLNDPRVAWVPVGCQVCIECRTKKSREWQVRLHEDIKKHKNGKFITLTYNTESLKKIITEDEESYQKCTDKQKKGKWKRLSKMKGYELDNQIATRSMRLFLERWRKKYKRSLRHWMVTELGDGHTEHMHMHGIVWTDNIDDIENIWQYGNVWTGNTRLGKKVNYVNGATVNYIVKYITKMDEKHWAYQNVILCSPGIGDHYTKTFNATKNKYNEMGTTEYYRGDQGQRIGLPIYWRNKIYTEEEREKLWIEKLDNGDRWVCGEMVKATDTETYNNLVEYHRGRTMALGYKSPGWIWNRKDYEQARRAMMQSTRLGI